MYDRFDVLKELIRKINITLYNELKQSKNNSNESVYNLISQNSSKSLADGSDSAVEQIDSQLSNLRQLLNAFETTNQEIRTLANELKNAKLPDSEELLNDQLSNQITTNTKAAAVIKSVIDNLRNSDSFDKNNTQLNVNNNVYFNQMQVLIKKFKILLSDFQQLNINHKKTASQKVKRQLKMLNPNITEVELNEILETSDASIIQEQIQEQLFGVNDMVKFAYENIKIKYNDVKKLEENVIVLHQLYVNLNTLIDHQGELIDNIENAVLNTQDYTEKAEKDMIEVKKNQRRKRNLQ